MGEYICRVGSETGHVESQTHQASSEGELRMHLAAQGYFVLSVRPKSILAMPIGGRRQGKIRADDLLIFNQQFMTLSKSGLPLQKSLDMLARQTRSEQLRAAVDGVRERVQGGALLSEAFEATQKFPKIYCATLRAGERSGSLDKVLSQYVTYQKTSRSFRKKFLSALIYPAFLMVFLCGLIVLIDTFIIPRFSELYSELDVPLPPLTVFVIGMGEGIKRAAVFILAGIALAIFALRSAGRSRGARLAWERLKFRLPVAGKLLLKFSVAEFVRTLSTLLQGGLPVVAALQSAGESVSSPLLAQGIEQARKEVMAGRPLSSSLRMTGFFPPMALDMVEVGESTGALPSMLEAVAEFFEEDVSIDLSTLVALVDPVMIAAIAVVVGFVLVAFYLPLFSLAGQVH
ncbi:MAG TPA: type II secretion system F family protein [Terriglobia bacterium]|nr:type II secretion system F family protein [Terriglobia bacterium]